MSPVTFLILSTTDWDAPQFGSRQQLGLRLARRGHRVLFVEQPRALHSLISDRRKTMVQMGRWLRGGLRQPIQDLPALQVYAPPPVLPIFYHSLTNPLSQRILKPAIRRTLNRLGWQADVFWTYWANSDHLVETFGEKVAVYHCIDNFRASGYPLVAPEQIIRLEEALCRKVDLVLTRTQGLADMLGQHSRQIEVMGGGVDVEQFRLDRVYLMPPELADIPQPMIGLVGSLDDRLDVGLLQYVAQALPAVNLVLAGFYRPHLVDLSALAALPNVHLLPALPHQRVPDFVAQFKVCLIPYLVNEFTQEVSPLKLYEFLALGKPVVATPLPYILRERAHIYLVESTETFTQAIETALAETQTDALRRKRHQVAKGQSWEAQVDRIEALMAQFNVP